MDKYLDFVIEPIIINNCLTGYAKTFDQSSLSKVSFDLEREVIEMDEFEELVNRAKSFLTNQTMIQKVFSDVAIELTDSAYSQNNYTPNEKDYKALESELVVSKINFYEEDLVFELFANNNYPDMIIYCQIDFNYGIIEISLGNKG